MDHAELIIAARRARAQAIHGWMRTLRQALRVWVDAGLRELQQRSRIRAPTAASWPRRRT
jgi:hypothetical protein